MKHLRLFKTENEYTSEVDNLDLPCITYVKETSEIGVHKENYIIAKYNLTSPPSIDMAYILGESFDLSTVKKMYIDDVEVTPDYYFPTSTSMGEHIVRIEFKKPILSCQGMFEDSFTMTEVDFSHFDTSNVTDMSVMFSSCGHLTSLDLSNFDTSKVTSMNAMFVGCRSLTSLDLSNFDTSKVTDMSSMFSSCNYLTSLDLSNFDTSKVTNMKFMFKNCDSLTSFDLSNFDTSNVTNMYHMFTECDSLTSLKMMGNINNLQNAENIFSDITTTGTFYYNSAYDYSKIIAELPSTWTAVAV